MSTKGNAEVVQVGQDFLSKKTVLGKIFWLIVESNAKKLFFFCVRYLSIRSICGKYFLKPCSGIFLAQAPHEGYIYFFLIIVWSVLSV